jgi:hypothetical protein
MKVLARRNTHVKYKSPTTHQSKVMTKVKVFEKKVKLQGQRVKIMESNERSCQRECTCEIWKPYLLPIKNDDKGIRFRLQGQISEGQGYGIK